MSARDRSRRCTASRRGCSELRRLARDGVLTVRVAAVLARLPEARQRVVLRLYTPPEGRGWADLRRDVAGGRLLLAAPSARQAAPGEALAAPEVRRSGRVLTPLERAAAEQAARRRRAWAMGRPVHGAELIWKL